MKVNLIDFSGYDKPLHEPNTPQYNIHPMMMDRNFVYEKFNDIAISLNVHLEFNAVCNLFKVQLNTLAGIFTEIIMLNQLTTITETVMTMDEELVLICSNVKKDIDKYTALANVLLDNCVEVTINLAAKMHGKIE